MPKKGIPLTEAERTNLSLQAKERWAQRKVQQSQPSPVHQPPIEEVGEAFNPPVKQQRAAVQARWAGERATEEEVRSHFETLPLDKALGLLDKMRKNCETAGKILNDRLNTPEVQKCNTCGITWDQFVKTARRTDWFLNRPHYHEKDRNIIIVDHYCSAACVSLENNKTQGVRGISDRGMLRSDNPDNHRIDLAKGAR